MYIIYKFHIFFKLYDSIPMDLRLHYLIQTSETSAFLTGLLTGIFQYLKKTYWKFYNQNFKFNISVPCRNFDNWGPMYRTDYSLYTMA